MTPHISSLQEIKTLNMSFLLLIQEAAHLHAIQVSHDMVENINEEILEVISRLKLLQLSKISDVNQCIMKVNQELVLSLLDKK